MFNLISETYTSRMPEIDSFPTSLHQSQVIKLLDVKELVIVENRQFKVLLC